MGSYFSCLWIQILLFCNFCFFFLSSSHGHLSSWNCFCGPSCLQGFDFPSIYHIACQFPLNFHQVPSLTFYFLVLFCFFLLFDHQFFVEVLFVLFLLFFACLLQLVLLSSVSSFFLHVHVLLFSLLQSSSSPLL